jgi:hypothetical protein
LSLLGPRFIFLVIFVASFFFQFYQLLGLVGLLLLSPLVSS